MTFLTPALAAIAAAIAIPALVILYFLKLKRRDAEVSSTLLWKKAIEDLQANAPFQRLRNNILLILQLLALLAALFALAQPEFRKGSASSGKHVIVIDRSASMKATDGDPTKASAELTRLDQAKIEAKKFVDTLREPGLLDSSGDEAMVVAFDTIADRICNFTSSKAELKRVIDSITATDSPTRFVPAFDTARAFAKPVMIEDKGIVNAGGNATIHLFSDGKLPDLADINPGAEDRLVYYPQGRTDSANLGIVGLRAERAFDEPSKLSIFVSIQNSASKPITTDVQLAVDGTIAGVRAATIPAARIEQVDQPSAAAPNSPPPDAATPPATTAQALPGVSGVVFTIERAQGAVITVQLRPPAGSDQPADTLATDNYGYLIVPPAKRLSVALVTSGNLFLRGALEALPLAKLDVYSTLDAAKLFDDTGKPTQPYDVYVLDSWLPTVPSRSGDAKAAPAPGLPQARVLAFNAPVPPPLGMIEIGNGEPTVVLKHDRDHPALRNIAMDALTISTSRKLSIPPRSPSRILAEGVSGPLIYESTDASTRAIVCTFDLLASNWPLDAGFVLFVAQSSAYLGHEASDTDALQIKPGSTIEQTLPPDATSPRVTLPDGTRRDLLLSPEGRVVFGPAEDVGIYTISWVGSPGPTDSTADGRSRRAFASNLLDARESDAAAAPADALKKLILNVQAGDRTQSPLRLWPWLLMAVLVLLLVEWWVYNRKVAI